MPKLPERKRRPWERERKPFQEREFKTDFYNTWPWRKARKAYLLENNLCVHCKEKKLYVSATVVDHIVPISKGGEKLDWNNFQALCKSCHNRKSARDRWQG